MIKYNKDHTAVVLKMNDTHVLLKLDTGDIFCVNKTCIDLKNEQFELF